MMKDDVAAKGRDGAVMAVRTSARSADLVVRRAVGADAAVIAALHVRAWRAAYADIVDTAHLMTLDVEVMARRFAAPGSGYLALDDPRVMPLAAVRDGRVCGWACAGPARMPEMPGAAAAELYCIYVDPAFFGAGAGTVLLRACMAHVRAMGCGTMDAVALKGNARAGRFYRRHGARRVKMAGETVIGGRAYDTERFLWDEEVLRRQADRVRGCGRGYVSGKAGLGAGVDVDVDVDVGARGGGDGVS